MKAVAQSLLIKALESATNAILISDHAGTIVWVNQAALDMGGYAHSEMIGHNPMHQETERIHQERYQDMWQTLLTGKPWHGELQALCKDGSRCRVNQVVTPLLDDRGTITHFITIQHSFAVVEEDHAEMRRLAYHDDLTGLPNRALFTDLVHQAIQHASVHHKQLAVMFIDLDQFKIVNDTLGHACGDKLLVAVAERLSRAVRRSDVVARLSGDEFAILISNLDQASIADTLAQQLIASIDRLFRIDEHQIATHISVGISFYPRDGHSFEGLITRADAAMYCAKAAGGGEVRVSQW